MQRQSQTEMLKGFQNANSSPGVYRFAEEKNKRVKMLSGLEDKSRHGVAASMIGR